MGFALKFQANLGLTLVMTTLPDFMFTGCVIFCFKKLKNIADESNNQLKLNFKVCILYLSVMLLQNIAGLCVLFSYLSKSSTLETEPYTWIQFTIYSAIVSQILVLFLVLKVMNSDSQQVW